MLRSNEWLRAYLLVICCVLPVSAQQPGVSAISRGNVVVPPLVSFNGVLTDFNGKPLTSITRVTFLLYEEEQGGAPLWMETQTVQPDKAGQYKVILGSGSSSGLPAHLFASGEARWLGVLAQGQEEQPRVLIVSVPYALKAVDAETVGGLPPSAFMLAAPPNGSTTANPAGSDSTGNSSQSSPALAGTGTADFIPLWVNNTTLGDSVLFQSGTGSTAKVGINTTTPTATLDVKGGAFVRGALQLPNTGTATASSGFNSDPFNLLASSFNSSTGKAVSQNFQWQAEPTGNDTSSPSGTLNLLFGSGNSKPSETGLKISNKGLVTFAKGQTFPGAGTITGVTAGTDLTGGGTSGEVTLNLNTSATDAHYARLGAVNTFNANQNITGNLFDTGNISATGSVTGQTGGFSGNGSTPVVSVMQSGGGVAVSAMSSIGTAIVGSGGTGVAGVSTSASGPGGSFTGFTAPTSGFNATAGIRSTGGSGDPNFGNGAPGIQGFGGQGGLLGADGAGGSFEGGTSVGFGDGVDAFAGSGVAGFFLGDMQVSGSITAGTKDFKIDHPLNPANKYLVHASVESSEMKNIYDGNVSTDTQGLATVQLPEWFEVLNTDFRYQLTVIGQFAQAIVSREIENNRFEIRTSAPGVKVSWQVTGVRQDAYAKAHPLVVEQEKEARLRGFYIHPELYGAPTEKQIEWARHPQMMQQIKEIRAKQRAASETQTMPHHAKDGR